MIFDPRMAAASLLLSSPNNSTNNNNNNSSFCDQINVNKINNTLNNSSTFSGHFSGQQNTTTKFNILSPPLSIKQEEASNTNSQQYFPTCSDLILQQPLQQTLLLREKSPTSTSFRIDTIIGENNERKNEIILKQEEEQNKEIKNNLFYSKQFISVQNLIEQLGGGIKQQQQQGQMMMLMMDKQLNSNNNFMSNEDNSINNEEMFRNISPCPQTSTNQLFTSENIRNRHSSPLSSSSETTTTTPITNTITHNGIKRNTNNNNNNCCIQGGKKTRKARTIFTDKQLQELETMFEHKRYLSVGDRMELAKRMNLSDTQVKTWYQNRRTKYKRQEQTNADMISEQNQIELMQNLARSDPYWTQIISQFISNPYIIHRLLPTFVSNYSNINNNLFNNNNSPLISTSNNNNILEKKEEENIEEEVRDEIKEEEEIVKLGKRKHCKTEDNEEIVKKVTKEL